MAGSSRKRSKTPNSRKKNPPRAKVTEEPKVVLAEAPKSHRTLINQIGALTIAIWLFTSIAILAKDVRDNKDKDGTPSNPYWPWQNGEEWLQGMSVIVAASLAFAAFLTHEQSTTKKRLLCVPFAMCLPVIIYKIELHHLFSFLGSVIFIGCAILAGIYVDWDGGWTIWRMYFDDELGFDDHDDRRRAKLGSAKRGGGKRADGTEVWGGGWWLGFRIINWGMGCSFILCAMCTLYEQFDQKLTLWQMEELTRRQWCFVSIAYLTGAFIATSIATKED